MFSKTIFVAVLSVVLSVKAVHGRGRFGQALSSKANEAQCSATVVRTVTVTQGLAPTAATTNNVGKTTTANNAVKTTSTAAAATTSAVAGGNGATNAQSSLTLDSKVIATGFANNGQDEPTEGQVPSLTSTNNFINFCLNFPNLPITNGQQITTGSCNPAPIGVIPSVDNMPSSKFVFPTNFITLKAGETFTIEMAIQNMQTGFFTNAQKSYFAAPQQLNTQGQIQGHSHVVIETLTSLTQTTPSDPKKFAFFKGLNAAAANGKLTATVPNGLTPGFYKLSSINTASNHQPVIAPVAQHGSLDDAIYFTVTSDGKALSGNNLTGSSSATTSSTATASTKTKTSLKPTSRTKSTEAKRAYNRL